jgi:lipoyl synthase
MSETIRKQKPEWLHVSAGNARTNAEVTELLHVLDLHTVCEEASCPNCGECFGRKTATFMILGRQCTRNCTFCCVSKGTPEHPDPQEPDNIAKAVRALNLKYVVITSVTRDDLPDGGAAHFVAVIRAIRTADTITTTNGSAIPTANTATPGHAIPITNTATPGHAIPNVAMAPTASPSSSRCPMIEVLIPDFQGDPTALSLVVEAVPEVLNHNIETVPRLYPAVRPQAVYERSLALLAAVKSANPSIRTKSGIMVGLGETEEEVLATMDDLRRNHCDFLTIGQYLAPSRDHHPVVEYIRPEVFARYKEAALARGFSYVASGPLVRSSYMAEEAIRWINEEGSK